ncbi:hypothetical protein TNCV_4037311 [Trichonephila clavipes]|nr:hypothetical protein TNCV_4037311 [Trichonephila clavipes]
MSSSWLKSVGNPLKTTFNCLLWAISNVWDRNFLSEMYFCINLCSSAEAGKTRSFPFSKRPSSGVSQNFPNWSRSSVALLCESITMGAIFVESVAKRGQRKRVYRQSNLAFPSGSSFP